MSSSGGGAGPPRYYCHACQQNTDVSFSDDAAEGAASGDLLCDTCGGPFVEQVVTSEDSDGLQMFIGGSGEEEGHHHADDDNEDGGEDDADEEHEGVGGHGGPVPAPELAMVLSRLLNRLFQGQDGGGGQALGGFGGLAALTGLAAVMGGGEPNGGAGISGVVGDYAIGDLSRIIEQLMVDDPNRHGAPPATQEEIDQVRGCTVKEGDELSRKECSICMDGMQPESHVMIMPCDHSFHDECLVPWLQQHATCPTCRRGLREEVEGEGVGEQHQAP